MLIAGSIERRQHVAGEFAGFLEHRAGNIAVEIAVMPGFDRGLQAGAVVEGEQHVVDRRTVGHDHGLACREGSFGLPSSHETGPLSTLPAVAGQEKRRHLRPGTGEYGCRERHEDVIRTGRVVASRKSVPSRLKWLNSLYRPALPEEIRAAIVPRFQTGLLGRSQAVRQWILIPPFGGSIPPRPSHPVLRFATVCNLRLIGPEIPAFRAFDFVSSLPISQSRERNCLKSPALSAEIPVLHRFSAETGSIATAARPCHSVSGLPRPQPSGFGNLLIGLPPDR